MEDNSSHTILIVDDNTVSSRLLTSILEGDDYRVITGRNSKEALEQINSQSPDMILLDVMMPGMNGFTLCRKLKKDHKFSDIPLIFLTALSQKEAIIEGFNAGGNDYITKPFNRQELLARVRNHLRLYDTLLENKRLTRLSEDASRSKTEFLATMSHEIRTPLNSIIGMAEVLADTALTDEQQNYVQIFRSAGESLLEIINDILDLSKIEAGQTELESIDFHLPSLLQSVVSILSVRAAEQHTQLSINLAPDAPHALSGDATRLRQILINLVGNGIKFAENGSVSISITPDSAHTLLFAVQDDGIGIHEDKQKIIFESFTQADSLTTRKYGGTGLGLTICKKLIKMLGGRIWLQSSPGKGTTFFFTFLFRPAVGAPLPLAGETVPENSWQLLKPASILLVDDNEDNRSLLTLYLRDTPFSIQTAANGKEAVQIFKRAHFDLVIIDIEMPIMDGYEATRQIRQWEQEQKIHETPIIALTAHAFIRFRKKCMAAGCSDYLTKPIRRNTLLNTIATHLQKEQSHTTQSTETSNDTEKPSSQESLTVCLDPKIKNLIPHFLKIKQQDAKQLLLTISSGDTEALRIQSHTMKGTSWMYGFKELGDMCLSLEKAAISKDIDSAHRLALHIQTYLKKIQISYRPNQFKNHQ